MLQLISMMQPDYGVLANKTSNSKSSSSFEGFLGRFNQLTTSEENSDSNEAEALIQQLLVENPELLEELSAQLLGSHELDLASLLELIQEDDAVLADLQKQLAQLGNEHFNQSVLPLHFMNNIGDLSEDEFDLEAVLKAAEKELLKYMNGDESFSARKLLALMEQWMNASNQDLNLDDIEMDEKQLRLWKQLLANYKRRNSFSTNHQSYKKDAVITAKDVTNWLAHQMKVTGIESSEQVSTRGQTLSMANVQQYVLYLNPSSESATLESQLMNQLEQSVKASRLFLPNSGINQLSFTLRPDNLGDMIVRLVEVQGEMTVKILVSSQATKSMLEANLHQLKHLFSPQQVVIEERNITLDDMQDLGEQEDVTEDEEDMHQENEENKQHDDDDDAFISYFEQFMLNEEV